MTTQLMTILAEGEKAYIHLERTRLAEENAKSGVEAARAALEEARAHTAAAKQSISDVVTRAEETGVSRKAMLTLIEERVAALLNSGLFNLDDATATEAPKAAPVKRMPRAGRKDETVTETATETNEAVIAEAVKQPEAEAVQTAPKVTAEVEEDAIEETPATPVAPAPAAAAAAAIPVAVDTTLEETKEVAPQVAETVEAITETTPHEVIAPAEPVVAVEPPKPARPSFLPGRRNT